MVLHESLEDDIQPTWPNILRVKLCPHSGLACLAMIACCHGYKTDITSLRQEYTRVR